MRYPDWAPADVIKCIELYDQLARERDGYEAAHCDYMAALWRRLATRPEMESVWPWILEKTELPLYENGEFFSGLGITIERFNVLPKLSGVAYEKEMIQIAEMAAALSPRLKKFEASTSLHGNPFVDIHWNIHKSMELMDRFETGQTPLFYMLNAEFPSIAEHLDRLEAEARKEALFQASRLRVSRKSNDFRAYFIREVNCHFMTFNAKGDHSPSPSKVATICSVALDDPDITPDLVRKVGKPGTYEED
jgi:hypothetical protein